LATYQANYKKKQTLTTQSDLKKGQSGLAQAIRMFKDDPDVGVVNFGIEDIQRSDFVGRAVTAYFMERSKG